MPAPRRLAFVAALLALAAPPAGAQDDVLEGGSVLDQPMEKEGWPQELSRRPLTLAPGLVEVQLPVGVNLSADQAGKPVFVAPILQVGVADGFMLSLRHAMGLCLTGASDGCPDTYADVGVDGRWRVARGELGEVALEAGLAAAPVSGPFALAGEGRILARFGGPIAFALAPALRFGLTERDTALSRPQAVSFPLATYGFGWVDVVGSNREYLDAPVSFTFQVTPAVAMSLGSALEGPLDPPTGSFGDFYRIPLGAALVVTPARTLDLGASLTFPNVLGRQATDASRWDARGLQVWAAFRI